MSSGPSAVLVLMFRHASVSCSSANGNVTGCGGSVSESIVAWTVGSIVLLKAGSSGSVEMDSKCFPMILRLSIGLEHGAAVGSGVVNVGSG